MEESNVEKIKRFVRTVTPDEYLNNLTANFLKGGGKSSKSYVPPENYRFLTELTNLPQSYHNRMNLENAERSRELKERLNRGKRLESLAKFWFKKSDGFGGEESLIDGFHFDLPVRGRIDFKINDSLCELKTKEKIPETKEEIMEEYLNDLEQLVFYVALLPHPEKENYLIFMKDSRPHEIKIFKVTVKDARYVREIIGKRIELLDEAIENEDPSGLGRCRYFNFGCQYKDGGICGCKDVGDSLIGDVLKNVAMEFDEDFTERMKEIQKNNEINDVYYSNHVLTPRRYFLKSGYEPDRNKEYGKSYFKDAVRKVMNKEDLGLNKNERDETEKGIQDKRFYSSPHKWLKLKSSKFSSLDSELVVPYITVIGNPEYDKGPSDYHVAQLAIIAGNYDKSQGVIFVLYPGEDRDRTNAFVLDFDGNKIHKIVKETLDKLDEAKGTNDVSGLPPCPHWMNCSCCQ